MIHRKGIGGRFEKKNMKDTDFEVDSDVAVNVGQITAEFSFKTFSEGWSNIDEMPCINNIEVDWGVINKRYVEYLRELADEMEK